MNKHLEQVSEFHNTFNHPILDTPQIPSKKRSDLRINLLQEELNELKDAINNNDTLEALDAFCDLLYVLNGAILEFGMGGIFDKAFDEVQRSNMSKGCSSIDEALSTLSFYKNRDNTEGYYKESNGNYLVYRNEDDKTLKSVNYSPANLSDFINV